MTFLENGIKVFPNRMKPTCIQRVHLKAHMNPLIGHWPTCLVCMDFSTPRPESATRANKRPILTALQYFKHRETLSLMDVKTSWNKTAHILCFWSSACFSDFKNRVAPQFTNFTALCYGLSVLHTLWADLRSSLLCVSYSMSKEGRGEA